MALDLEKYIASIRDFPTEGILFRDVTPLLQDPEAFQEATDRIAAYAESVHADVIVGPESRGFLVGAPVAYKIHKGIVPVRKPVVIMEIVRNAWRFTGLIRNMFQTVCGRC